jgi:hypothetical protein
LRSRAQLAGFRDVTYTASTWCFANPHDVAWWSQTWAERVVSSDFARQAVEGGFADSAELAELSAGWRWWGDQPDAWFAVLHGELLATVG